MLRMTTTDYAAIREEVLGEVAAKLSERAAVLEQAAERADLRGQALVLINAKTRLSECRLALDVVRNIRERGE